ncbi:palindromic element RPE1 domain-containing protein [Rickettsia hoogstraalii]|nr:palindromic element RPE1 domain-containing protein [Rickettsia hoogstraalii]MCX4084036.1 palindromic element RPE1 domain-containing protein [Rickettsia hoogstraalii]
MFIRCLSKPAYREEFKGDTEVLATTAYVEVREDASRSCCVDTRIIIARSEALLQSRKII